LFLFFLQGVALALPSTVVPSPLKVFLISEALTNGWRRTLPACFAPLITDGPIIIVALLVLTQTPNWFLDTLRILGGFFILYLAVRLLRILRTGKPALKAPNEKVARQNLLKAVGVNVFNPNPYILWGVVAGPIVLQGWREQSFLVGFSLIIGFYITFVAGLMSLVIIFAKVGELNPRLNTFMTALSAVALLVFGVYQISTGTMALLS
jgi:threonine/homoserine/homoserine lactone efflux protein